MAQTVKLSEALKFVHPFAGNRPVEPFLDECQDGYDILDNADKPKFLLMLKTKLTDEALRTTQGMHFANLEAFKNHFRELYRPTESYSQLHLKLASTYQFPEETIVTYKIRLSDLSRGIKQAYITEYNPNEEDLRRFNETLSREEVRFFKSSLFDHIRLSLGEQNVDTLENCASRSH